jgi:capsular exopolysaccharide synthesis family protein
MSQEIQQSPVDPLARLHGAPTGRIAETEAHMLDYLATLYRHRYVAAGAFLLVLLGSLLNTYTTTPMYRAQARLMIEIEDEQSAAVVGVFKGDTLFDPEPYYQTQYRILSSRELARRAVQKLSPAQVQHLVAGRETASRTNRLLRTLRQQPDTHEAGPGVTPPVEEAAAIDSFMGRVRVEPVRSSRLVDVTFVAADPSFAAEAVNLLAREYVDQNSELRRQNVTTSLEWLTQELARQKTKLEDSERAMATYREQQNAMSLEDRQNIVVARLNQLNDVATRARTGLAQKKSLYDQVMALGSNVSPDTIPAILQNQYIQAIKTQLADLERERANLSERYGDRHPEIIKINASIRDASRQLQAELSKAIDAIKNDYQSAVAEEKTLASALEDQKGTAMALSRKSVSYTVLEREAQSNRQVYESLLQREKELQVLASSRGNNVRLMEPAEPPGAPFTPNVRRSLLLASIAGLVLACGLVFGLNYLDDTVKTPDDITNKLKVPFLGMVPRSKGATPLLSGTVPHEFGEAFRSLRTSLVFSNGTGSGRVVVVTSAQPLEGKSTTACNLAIALAIGGEKVLLIDADLRRPGVTRTMKLEHAVGLSHLLTGQATPREAIRQLDTPNLWVIPSGTIPPNPSELLASDRMKMLLTGQHGWFDWVIVDTPPVLAVTDAVLLAPLASGVAFIIRSEMTPSRHVRRALETLMTGNPRLLGAILNGVDLDRNKYYYSRYYGYEHTSYYTATAS